jgi:hypothetical protein
MHLSGLVEPSELQASVIAEPSAGLAARAKRRLRWWFDIDDGGGAITLMAAVILVFGTLFIRLVDLNHSLNVKAMNCRALDTTTLQVSCQYE